MLNGSDVNGCDSSCWFRNTCVSLTYFLVSDFGHGWCVTLPLLLTKLIEERSILLSGIAIDGCGS